MPEDNFLTDDFLRQLISVGEVDVLVAIPTHNNVKSICQTVEAVESCFQASFTRERVVVLNVDGGSKDGTTEAFTDAALRSNSGSRGVTSLRTEHRVTTRYGSSPSAGRAFRAILAAAELLRAKASAVVSPAATNLGTEWVRNLLQPLYRQNFEFVAPLYTRQKFDGLLARTILYPMTRAVFGRGMRELQSSEMGFSGRLASFCLNQDVWHQEAVLASPEIWMAISAISSDFRCCQSYLGQKLQSSRSSSPDIVAIVRQTLGTLFWCLESQERVWMSRTESESVQKFGPDHDLSPESGRVSRKRLFDLFRGGVSELSAILASVLAADTHAEIQRIATLEERTFRFENPLWVRCLYEFAAAYHHAVLNRDHLIQAFVPLYRGQIYSFLLQHQDSSTEEIEENSESLCLEFERQKPYLIARWKDK